MKRFLFSLTFLGRLHYLLILALALSPIAAASPSGEVAKSSPTVAEGPLTAAQALAAFQLEPGLKVELVAAEPDVVDPVAVCFDERGRLYVAENRGYPTGPGEGKAPVGTIALLEDADGNGLFKKKTLFAEGLTFPNGLLPWNGGLFVTCAPDLLYLKDTDGDGRADIRRVVFTGFATNKSTQLRVCYPTLGPDDWIYLSSGLSGGKIKSPDYPNHPVVDIERNDFRFKPDTDQFEAADGKGQFGMTFDEFGHRFTCMNRVHVQHIVLPSHYLKRNPNLAFSDTMQNVPENMINDLLKGDNRAARIFPISANITTADSHAGTFTAACGVMIYRGTALPAEYLNQVFACDPTGNLVHWDRLSPTGATFTARRARDGIEFLASPDTWFRPVFLANAPDGAIYLCDMYRKTIEHPEYLPQEIRKKADFESGKNQGRVWRVAGKTASRKIPPLEFANARASDLVKFLGHANGWHRDTAFRLLLERRDSSAVPELKAALLDGHASSAGKAVRALSLLDAFAALDEKTLMAALAFPHPGVRERALQLAEKYMDASPKVTSSVLNLADDSDARVRFQCALTLGSAPFPRDKDDVLPPPLLRGSEPLVNALARIANRDATDRWTRAAILSSTYGHAEALWDALIRELSRDSGDTSDLLGELGKMLAAHPPRFRLFNDTLRSPIDFDRKTAFLVGYADGLENRGKANTNFSQLKFLGMLSSDSRTASNLDQLFQQARANSVDDSQPVPRRLRAIGLLAHADGKDASTALFPLLEATQPTEIQIAAVRALIRPHHAGVIGEVLSAARWRSFTPPIRKAILSALLSRAEFLPSVLAALESGALLPSALDGNQRNQLLRSKDASARQRAESLFKHQQGGDRMKVYDEFKSVLQLKTKPENGRAMFKQNCASCHRLDREGIPVGPDLFGIRNQPKEAILLHVLVPDYEIAPGFAAYVIETKDGRTLSGLILSETTTSVTLRQAQGIEETILRTNIVSLLASNVSLMPQELEKTMSRQDLADLIAYLKGE